VAAAFSSLCGDAVPGAPTGLSRNPLIQKKNPELQRFWAKTGTLEKDVIFQPYPSVMFRT
jgi:hypothetical protein